jgi:hypothetical protein
MSHDGCIGTKVRAPILSVYAGWLLYNRGVHGSDLATEIENLEIYWK